MWSFGIPEEVALQRDLFAFVVNVSAACQTGSPFAESNALADARR